MAVELLGFSELQAEFAYRGKWARQRSYSLALQYGRKLVDAARQNASGRPGPEIITGEYVASFTYEVTDLVGEGGIGSTVSVGTDAIQAMRLEYGFVGTDARGVHVEAPPYPHWGPAADMLEDSFVNDVADIADFDIGSFERGF